MTTYPLTSIDKTRAVLNGPATAIARELLEEGGLLALREEFHEAVGRLEDALGIKETDDATSDAEIDRRCAQSVASFLLGVAAGRMVRE